MIRTLVGTLLLCCALAFLKEGGNWLYLSGFFAGWFVLWIEAGQE